MRDYRGIDKAGLNRTASLEALTYEELRKLVNGYWKENYGHNIVTDYRVKGKVTINA